MIYIPTRFNHLVRDELSCMELSCHHFDALCFYGNIMAPIPSRAETTQATLIMRSHFAAVSDKALFHSACAVHPGKP